MSSRTSLSALAAALVFAASATASAQATRTFISGVGDDINPCSRTAPCRTFAGAIAKTATGGEIDVLDSGGFGAVTITKSITIDGSPYLSGVLVSGTNGLTINAPAGSVVVLRGLDINGIGAGLDGVQFLAGGSLVIEDCVIYGFAQNGIAFLPGTPSAGAQLVVRNTTVRNVVGASVLVYGTAGAVPQVTLDKVLLAGSGTGLEARLDGKVTVHDSVATGHSAYGVHALDTAEVNVDHGIVANSVVGVQAETGATVRLSEVMLSHNTSGVVGNVVSFGNNRIAAGNGTNGVPASTIPLQ